ncbi:MAG: hypothetical protein IPK52_21135 [Chloroflexi bacterium]|nr:hypothetical protein [Chloroflexota bacterium]
MTASSRDVTGQVVVGRLISFVFFAVKNPTDRASSSPTSCRSENHARVSLMTVCTRSFRTLRVSAATATVICTMWSASPLLISCSARRQSAMRCTERLSSPLMPARCT